MTQTRIHSINHSVQETQIWLNELTESETFEVDEQAYAALRAVLHALRDRLTPEEAVHLSAQLPMVVRGFYFEGWKLSLAPNTESTQEEFFAAVESSLAGNQAMDGLDPAAATRAVFELLDRKLDEGQIRHVQTQLPAEIKALWPRTLTES